MWVKDRIERWRRELLANVEADIARLESEVESQKIALADVARCQSLLREAPRQAVEPAAPVIAGIVEQILKQRARRRRVRIGIVGTVTALLALAFVESIAPLALHNRVAKLVESTSKELRIGNAGAEVAPAIAAGTAASSTDIGRASTESILQLEPVIVEESKDAFGLAQSTQSDVDIAGAVRDRLSRLPALAGFRVSFAVKDGWVWLRGHADEKGRDAAGQALGDLGDGVLVVNQIEITSRQQVAER